MKLKFIKIAFFSFIMCVLAAVPAFAATIGGGTVEASGLNLRTEASTESAVKLVIPSKAFVLVEEQTGDWYKVLYNGQEGYVSGEYVSFAEAMDGSYAVKGTVNGSSVRLRAGASLDSKVIGYANTGATYEIVGVSGEWIKVKNGDHTCYIYSDYLVCTGTAVTAATTDPDIVTTAKGYLGSRYVWGGMSPAGFDCSGFVGYIYKLYGYSLHRVAQDIYSYDGTWVSRDDLQPGDIVCFGSSGKSIGHVGMYIGDGQFIHASTYTTGVIISNLTDGSYTRNFQGGKRIMS